MTIRFFLLYVPVVALLFLASVGIGYALAWLERRAVPPTDDEDTWDGRIAWPTEADIVDGLRDCAGDVDDVRRRQIDARIAEEERVH